MALIVENGSGVIGAESYVTVADMDTYASNYGCPEWPSGSTSAIIKQKEVALRKAAQYVDGHYGQSFPGQRRTAGQGLLWPRTGAALADGTPIAPDNVPAQIIAAQCEASRLTVKDAQLTPQTSTGPLLKRKRTDVLEKEWFEGSYSQTPVFGNIDLALAPLLGGENSDIITTSLERM